MEVEGQSRRAGWGGARAPRANSHRKRPGRGKGKALAPTGAELGSYRVWLPGDPGHSVGTGKPEKAGAIGPVGQGRGPRPRGASPH